ncbi:DEAD/DEAH box helicase [Helicobacter cynogastricus]|uniref:DEAD/DEAH box helicase n=1 Tax=Helicobacter cynogastricus TaxID=329937 RepID=UPI000CF09C2A|nr:DEAD/DEAH box helicase [Helicobacter cynogastricus]
MPTQQNVENLSPQETSVVGFKDLGLHPRILKSIAEAGFVQPSPIQEKAIPVILQGRDVIAQAQTGTGKTAAFALPIIHNLKNDRSVEALIITPTRELAMQISDEIFRLGKSSRTRTICIYGGQSIRKQCELLERHPQVMIATPGRLLDHLKNKRLKHFNPKVVVLDESDEMLDMGFLDDIEEIFDYLPNDAQILLFSATMPPPIKDLANKILQNPASIHIAPANITNADISQRFYVINEHERNEAIMRLLDKENHTKSIIFMRMKREVDELHHFLVERGYKTTPLHGDMEQRARQESIKAFKSKHADVLVATDVASRGLDISDVSHVFNYHLPLNTESYIHRIGRTGRAGKKGIAITLVTPLEYKELQRMQKEIDSTIELYEIPDMNEDRLVRSLSKVEVDEEVVSLYERLMEQFEPAQLTLKLLSLQFKSQKISKEDFLSPSKSEHKTFRKRSSHSKPRHTPRQSRQR